MRANRRTVATRMADLGVQPHIVEAVLNHVSGHKIIRHFPAPLGFPAVPMRGERDRVRISSSASLEREWIRAPMKQLRQRRAVCSVQF
jgi:hypothetical protein